MEVHGEVVTRLDVAQHEERDEDQPQAHQHREPDAVFARLQGTATLASAPGDRRGKRRVSVIPLRSGALFPRITERPSGAQTTPSSPHPPPTAH